MSKYKVPAYTILEITIAMLLSALVLGIAYTAFSIVSKGYSAYQVKNNETAAVLRLDELLIKDFRKSKTVLKDTNGLSLLKDDRVIRYQFTAEYVTRHDVVIDTFKLQTANIEAGFEDHLIDGGSDTTEQNRIDRFHFDLLIRGQKIPYHYHKQYSSANLLPRPPDAVD